MGGQVSTPMSAAGTTGYYRDSERSTRPSAAMSEEKKGPLGSVSLNQVFEEDCNALLGDYDIQIEDKDDNAKGFKVLSEPMTLLEGNDELDMEGKVQYDADSACRKGSNMYMLMRTATDLLNQILMDIHHTAKQGFYGIHHFAQPFMLTADSAIPEQEKAKKQAAEVPIAPKTSLQILAATNVRFLEAAIKDKVAMIVSTREQNKTSRNRLTGTIPLSVFFSLGDRAQLDDGRSVHGSEACPSTFGALSRRRIRPHFTRAPKSLRQAAVEGLFAAGMARGSLNLLLDGFSLVHIVGGAVAKPRLINMLRQYLDEKRLDSKNKIPTGKMPVVTEDAFRMFGTTKSMSLLQLAAVISMESATLAKEAVGDLKSRKKFDNRPKWEWLLPSNMKVEWKKDHWLVTKVSSGRSLASTKFGMKKG
eukprot:1319550-Amorphochlora_amoeboformis.AAC.1